MPRRSPSPKLVIPSGPETDGRAVAAVSREAQLRLAGLVAVAEWEAEHGLLNAEEMEEGRRSVRQQMLASVKA